MPTLKSYKDSSDQSGLYLIANVGGSNPITLQITHIGEKILRETGHKSGNSVPNDLVWAMYDVGLLYTSSTVSNENELIENTGEALGQINITNKLSDAECKQLLQYLTEYSGENQSKIAELVERLKQSLSDNSSNESDDEGSFSGKGEINKNLPLNEINDPDSYERMTALEKFKEVARDDPASVVPYLDVIQTRFDDSEELTAEMAFSVFTSIAKEDSTLITEYFGSVAAYLNSQNERIRYRATEFFEKAAADAPAAVSEHVDKIQPRLEDSNETTRRLAFRAFYRVCAGYRRIDDYYINGERNVAEQSEFADMDEYIELMVSHLESPEDVNKQGAINFLEIMSEESPELVKKYMDTIDSHASEMRDQSGLETIRRRIDSYQKQKED
jgi:hypothetical protein